jgi:release factor glutamine methyltransferase
MTTNPGVAEWLNAAAQRLMDQTSSEKTRSEAALEAQVLLAHALDRPRAWLLAHPETCLTDDLLVTLQAQLEKLAEGVPLPYLTGEQEFYGISFAVTPDVLIPRPETELLVETALAWLNARSKERRVQAGRAADVGTGSGCIAAALALHVPSLTLVAADRSRAALRVAQLNLQRYSLLERVWLVQSNLLAPLHGTFDLICANLPYIPTTTLGPLPVARHEPRLALDGGPDGLRLVSDLLASAPRLLAPGGLILLEIEASQGESSAHLARTAFPGAKVDILPDLAGLDRLVRVENQ